jgi:hypothetical protein
MAKARKRRKRRPATAARKPAGTPPAAGGRAPARAPVPIDDQRPPAPWGSFPLIELLVLVGLVLFVVGFFFVEGSRGTSLFVAGLAVASLAGLELSIREHFGGFRSHSLLLAGVAGLATMLGLYYLAGLPPALSAGAAVAVVALGFWGLAADFRRRSGRLVKLR